MPPRYFEAGITQTGHGWQQLGKVAQDRRHLRDNLWLAKIKVVKLRPSLSVDTVFAVGG